MSESLCLVITVASPALGAGCRLLFGLLPAMLALLVLLLLGLVIYFILLPWQAEKASSVIYRFLGFLGASFKKRYIKHDLQGRVAEFVKDLAKQAPGLETQRLSVEWVNSSIDRDAFLEEGKVVLRLREDDPHDMNFAHGAYLFVSTSLLFRVKRYLSKPQRTAIDLFVTTQLIEREKPSVVLHFLESYLHPNMHDSESKLALLYDQFSLVHGAGFFFPVLIQELDFLGRRVFGDRKDDLIVNEVYGLAEFLVHLSERQVGEVGDLQFERQYCHCAVLIVGKPWKLEDSIFPYVGYIRNALAESDTDTIYVIARAENRSKIDLICSEVSDIYNVAAARMSKGIVHYPDKEIPREQYIVALSRKGAKVYYSARDSKGSQIERA